MPHYKSVQACSKPDVLLEKKHLIEYGIRVVEVFIENCFFSCVSIQSLLQMRNYCLSKIAIEKNILHAFCAASSKNLLALMVAVRASVRTSSFVEWPIYAKATFSSCFH